MLRQLAVRGSLAEFGTKRYSSAVLAAHGGLRAPVRGALQSGLVLLGGPILKQSQEESVPVATNVG